MVWALAMIAACAAAAPGHSAEKISPAIIPNFSLPDLSAASATYKLSTDEMAYDCKKLSGHIRVRIRQLRSTRADKKTSAVARSMQHAATPLVGGTLRGIDPDGDNARDLAMLKVYNGRLAVKSCPTYNLERLLAPGNTDDPLPDRVAKKPPAVLFKAAKPGPVAPAAAPAPAPAPVKP